MRYKHVFAICAYKDSPSLERCIRSLKAQTVPSHIIICTSTPSSYIDRLAWKYGLQVYVRQGESNICLLYTSPLTGKGPYQPASGRGGGKEPSDSQRAGGTAPYQ